MLFVGGHGHLREGGDLIGVWAEAAGGDGVSQEVGSGGANFGFDGGKFKAVFAQALEKGSDVGGVVGRDGVEAMMSSRYAATRSRPLMTSLMTLTNQPWEALLPCGMTSHSQSRLGVQNAVSEMVSLSMVIWWKETRSKREKIRPLPKESRTSSTRGMGSCPSELMAFSFL